MGGGDGSFIFLFTYSLKKSKPRRLGARKARIRLKIARLNFADTILYLKMHRPKKGLGTKKRNVEG